MSEQDHLDNLGVDGRIRLKGNFKEYARVGAWTGLKWLTTRTSCGHFAL
jgi:hypothetical protein